MSEQKDEGVIRFKTGNPPEVVLILDKDGFVYKGQRIEDAGEAHKLFVDWIKTAKAEQL